VQLSLRLRQKLGEAKFSNVKQVDENKRMFYNVHRNNNIPRLTNSCCSFRSDSTALNHFPMPFQLVVPFTLISVNFINSFYLSNAHHFSLPIQVLNEHTKERINLGLTYLCA
jgi:hypothetical protein